jgi:hypothetical protein
MVRYYMVLGVILQALVLYAYPDQAVGREGSVGNVADPKWGTQRRGGSR